MLYVTVNLESGEVLDCRLHAINTYHRILIAKQIAIRKHKHFQDGDIAIVSHALGSKIKVDL